VGTVDVFKPLPKLVICQHPYLFTAVERSNPVTSLPEMKWPRVEDEHCKAAPTTMMDEPRKMVFRRPKGFPMKMVVMAPKKHPTLYDATDIPVVFVSIDHDCHLPQRRLTLDGRPMIFLRSIEVKCCCGRRCGIDLGKDSRLYQSVLAVLHSSGSDSCRTNDGKSNRPPITP